MLIPKPFIPESELESDEQRIFVPKQPSIIDGLHYCACVHVCKQFMDYPVDNWGRRIIPHDAKCPMVGTDDVRYGTCENVCEQFMNFPVDAWGRRILPHGAKCPMVKPNDNAPYCTGRLVSVNGRILRATSDYPEPCLVYEHQKTR